jgi:hypothetical protein
MGTGKAALPLLRGPTGIYGSKEYNLTLFLPRTSCAPGISLARGLGERTQPRVPYFAVIAV